MWVYDGSTPEKAMGISDYAFVAKVDKILRTEYKNPVEIEITANGEKKEMVYDPYTVYEITVIENIKWEIVTGKPIELIQYGGLNYDRKSYTFLENGELLEEGDYYILLANVWPDGNILESSDPARIIKINNYSKSNINNTDDNVLKYKKAYQNQIIPEEFKENNLISKYDIKYIK